MSALFGGEVLFLSRAPLRGAGGTGEVFFDIGLRLRLARCRLFSEGRFYFFHGPRCAGRAEPEKFFLTSGCAFGLPDVGSFRRGGSISFTGPAARGGRIRRSFF